MSENLNNEDLEQEKTAQDASAEQKEDEEQEADVEVLNAKQEDKDEAETKEEKEQNEQEDYKKRFYYLAAEMENMKKRFEREKQNLLKYGNEKLLNGLVEVVDNFDRTLQALENEDDKKILNIVEGINMVKNQMTEVLKKNGLEEVEAEGKIFDPNYHEAMAQQPSEDKEDQEVVSVFQKGYVLNGRLLRPAKVVVAKNEK